MGENQTDEFDSLHDAIEATRKGIAHLARDLQMERLERKEIKSEIERLAGLGPSVDKFKKAMTSELTELVRDSVANAKVDIHSRVQLLMVEMRGQLEATPLATINPSDIPMSIACATSL